MSKAADTVGQLMVKDVITVDPERLIEDAIRLMVSRGTGSVVIVKDDEPVGIFTERDFLRSVIDDPELMGRHLGEVMTKRPVTIEPDVEVFDAFEVMTAKGIRRLPVTKEGRLVGIITERDLLRWVRDVGNE